MVALKDARPPIPLREHPRRQVLALACAYQHVKGYREPHRAIIEASMELGGRTAADLEGDYETLWQLYKRRALDRDDQNWRRYMCEAWVRVLTIEHVGGLDYIEILIRATGDLAALELMMPRAKQRLVGLLRDTQG